MAVVAIVEANKIPGRISRPREGCNRNSGVGLECIIKAISSVGAEELNSHTVHNADCLSR